MGLGLLWGPLSSDWSCNRHTVTPTKPGGSVAHQTTSNLLVGEGAFGWMDDTPCPLVWGCWSNPPPKPWLWCLYFMPLNKGRVSLAVTTGLEGCSTFSQPGNLFGGLFSVAGSMVIPTVASLMGCQLALVGHSGDDLLGWEYMGVSSGRATPLNTYSSEKER